MVAKHVCGIVIVSRLPHLFVAQDSKNALISRKGQNWCIFCTASRSEFNFEAALSPDLSLQFLGVPDEAIAQDYALTRLGLEPMRQMLIVSYKDLFDKYLLAAVALASCKYVVSLTFPVPFPTILTVQV
jgi:hypothetical protein